MNKGNPHLLQRLEAIRQVLKAHYEGGKGISSTVAGSERETFLREFLQKVFPAHRRFATGVITDSAGRKSGQVDIAVELPFFPSFPLLGTEDRLLLAESVAIVIEVKSNLSKQWGQVMKTVKSIKPIKRNITPVITIDKEPSPTIPVIAVGYTGYKTIESLKKRLDSTLEESRPDAALVIDSGCFFGPHAYASGAYGLYELCYLINLELSALTLVATDLLSYVPNNNED